MMFDLLHARYLHPLRNGTTYILLILYQKKNHIEAAKGIFTYQNSGESTSKKSFRLPSYASCQSLGHYQL